MGLFYRRLPKFEYVAPQTLDEVLHILSARKEKVKLLAGGTDLMVQLKRREMPVPECVLDIKGIPGLDNLSFDNKSGLKIGAATTIQAIAGSAKVQQHFPALLQAAKNIASPQVRNRGTFAGNICNAVPSADSAPALLALKATVKLKSLSGERTVPIEEFFTGPRKTVLRPDEMLLEIHIPAPIPDSNSTYLKLSPRHSMDLAIVGVAAWGTMKGGTCQDVAIALGAVAPTPLRAPVSEAMLKGQKITPELIEKAAQRAMTQCSPIDDHRASQEYRCDMVRVMTKRALTQVLIGG